MRRYLTLIIATKCNIDPYLDAMHHKPLRKRNLIKGSPWLITISNVSDISSATGIMSPGGAPSGACGVSVCVQGPEAT